MAVTDWDIYKSDSGAIVSLDTATPMEGSSSVVLDVAGTLGDSSREHIALIPSDSSGLPHGFTTARLRSLIRVRNTSTGSSNRSYGFVFQQSQDNITGITGECYMARLHIPQSPVARKVSLLKCTQGFNVVDIFDNAPGTTLLAEVPLSFGGSIVDDDIIPFEVEWITDLIQLNGIQVSIRHGNLNDTDFTNLNASSPVITFVDTSAPFITTVGEGIAIRHGGEAAFDTTILFQLV
jgi:hypothetical protein